MRYVIFLIFISFNLKADIVEKLRPVYDYKIITNEALEQEIIVKPMGAWIHLINFNGVESSCLFYKTPFKEDAGVLKLIKKFGESCDEKTVWWYQGGVQDLSLTANNKIILRYKIKDEDFQYTLNLINRLYPKTEYKLFDPPQKKKNLIGIHLLK